MAEPTQHREEDGEGRHAGLLEIDAVAGRGRWLLVDAQGAPHRIRFADYAPFLGPADIGLSRLTLGASNAPGQDGAAALSEPPVIRDCAWLGNEWLVYAGGFRGSAVRFGLAPSVLGAHRSDLSMREALFEAPEPSFGRLCASLDRLILTPLRKNGPAKGKQSMLRLSDKATVRIGLPRGCTQHSLVEYFDGCYWLLPMPWGYGADALVACSEA